MKKLYLFKDDVTRFGVLEKPLYEEQAFVRVTEDTYNRVTDAVVADDKLQTELEELWKRMPHKGVWQVTEDMLKRSKEDEETHYP